MGTSPRERATEREFLGSAEEGAEQRVLPSEEEWRWTVTGFSAERVSDAKVAKSAEVAIRRP
jgi:hypothetical protein